MRKNLLFFFFLLVASYSVFAQLPYGNEWIKYDRPYFRIDVEGGDLNHITASVLLAAGVPVNQSPGKFLALYHNGHSVPIFVSTDATFSSNDYVEFYSEIESGQIEGQLYRNSNDQINPYRSLFNNLSSYFLVVEDQPNSLRFTQANNNINVGANWNPEKYFMKHVQVDYPNRMYYPGKYYSVGSTETYKSIYDVGEGYTDNQYMPATFTAITRHIYTQGPDAVFKTIFSNNSALPDYHQVKISLNNVNTLHLQQIPQGSPGIPGFQLNHVQSTIPIAQLIDGNNSIYYEDLGNAQSAHKGVVGCLSIDYPCTFDLSGGSQFLFNLPGDALNNKHIEINNFVDQGTLPVLLDLTNHTYYRSVQVPGTNPLKFNLLPSAQDRQLVVRAESYQAYFTVPSLTAVNFTNYTNTANGPQNQGEYIIITKINSDLSNGGYLEDYRKYRDQFDNPNGGKYFHSRIADIDMLYDEFGYGIRKSPLAIRNFIRYLHDSALIKPKFVFLVGKGREAPDMRDLTNPTQVDNYNQCLVPTFGYPGSDNLLAATQPSDTPIVAIGRLAAQTGQQVKDYLDKVKLYEQQQNTYVCAQDIPSKVWQKNVLHFSGGTTPGEQFLFKYYVDSYKQRVRDSLWGANVTSHWKTTNNPIDQSEAQIIRNEINNGVSWITFFGHSATGAFDFSIDEPENYNNSPKFPIILSNGCFSGFIHDRTPGFSERFVLEADKGAIAFMATSSLSVSSGLDRFSSQLYKNISVPKYYNPLGIQMKQALTDLFKDSTLDDYALEIAYEMTLHGDPGLWPNQYPKPDFAIDESSVFTSPATVTPGVDTFEVKIVVTNLGKCAVKTNSQTGIVTKDTILVSLKRTIFDASNNPVYYYYSKNMAAPFYKDTISFNIPVNISTLGYGQNLFDPYVDAGFKIDEMAECNNGLTTPFSIYIQNDDVIPIYPYDFAIVPRTDVTLKASTINPFAPERAYRIEIDTSELFASPTGSLPYQKRDTVITQKGGVIHWRPVQPGNGFVFQDSTVYYWRIKRDTAGATWHYSSFLYLNNEYPGWNQSHYFQYKKDSYQNMSLDTSRVFRFPSSVNTIHVKTGVTTAVDPHGNVDFETLGWDYNNYNEYRYRMGGCGYYGGLTFAVIDPVSGLPWISHNNGTGPFGDQFHNFHCPNKGDQPGFDFLSDGSQDNDIVNFINAIPPNFYVLMYSTNNIPYIWTTTLVNALSQLGFVSTPYTNGSVTGALVYFTQKGNPNFNSFTANTNGHYSILDTTFTFNGLWYQGTYTSPKIGPAVEWHSFHWRKQLNWQLHPSDVDSVDIIGIKASGQDSLLLRVSNPNTLFYNGGPTIDAHEFPYLKLRMNTRDDSLRTPGQLYYWRILYKQPPEAAVNPSAWFNFTDQVNQGSNMKLEVALENVSDVNMDSILTKYTLRDAHLNVVDYYIRHNPLGAFDTMHMVFNRNINGGNYNGTNRLIVEANPNSDQIEQYHFNNFLELNFSTIADKINPLLDVTFDNQHIMNGDIVSAKPTIHVMLKDENKYLALDDSSLLQVYIRYPGASEPVKIDQASGIPFTFYPANSANLAHDNKAQMEIKPVFTVDGTYELLVKDQDRSGNNSATTDALYQGTPATYFDYKTTFEVVNKPMVSNVLNYPNPFTTSTKFVFTITGSEVPDFMKIQIITIKGTVVKEIFKDELGPLHIGRNITEYAWDGRDQYGDLLANGIYFYHVITRLDDKQMDNMGMSYDKYFKKGFGKMAIVR